MPKVSVIIPVYNVEKYIDRCIDSILCQTFQDFEIIVVNDATPDKSMDIINRYAKFDSRIHIVNNDENSGLMWTRMVGYQHASGDYFVFCDSDDWIPTDALEILYSAINESDYDIVAGNIRCCNNEGQLLSILSNDLRYGNDKKSVFKSLLHREFFHSLWAKIYKSYLFQNADFGTQKHFINSEDAIVFYQLVERASKIGTTNSIVYNYFQNINSYSKIKLGDRAIECMAIANQKIKSIIKNYPELAKELNEYLVYTTYWWILLGSRNYYKTKKNLKKYQMQEYISIRNCFSGLNLRFSYIKILLRSLLLH